MLTVNLDKSLVVVIISCYFLNLFPFNFVFSRGDKAPPLELPGGGKRTTAPPYVRHWGGYLATEWEGELRTTKRLSIRDIYKTKNQMITGFCSEERKHSLISQLMHISVLCADLR